MDSYVMLGLGDFRFGIATAAYEELSRSNAWRWPEFERVGVKPALQFTGPTAEKIEMRGSIYPAFRRQNQGLQQMPALKALADKGEAMSLVDGNGRYWGEYVIETLRETQRTFFSDGTPRRVEFEVCLKEFN